MEILKELMGVGPDIGFAGAEEDTLAALREHYKVHTTPGDPVSSVYISYADPSLVRRWIREWMPVLRRSGTMAGNGWDIEHYGLQRMLAEEFSLLVVNIEGPYWWVMKP